MTTQDRDQILLNQIGEAIQSLIDKLTRTNMTMARMGQADDRIGLTMARMEQSIDRMTTMAGNVGQCLRPRVNPRAHYYASEYRSVSDPVRVRVG